MDRPEAFAELRAVAVEILAVEPEAVFPEARFREDLGAGSLDIIEFVMALEDRIHCRIPESQLKSIVTVGQALDLILALKSAGHE